MVPPTCLVWVLLKAHPEAMPQRKLVTSQKQPTTMAAIEQVLISLR
jgi:hypothetical protein